MTGTRLLPAHNRRPRPWRNGGGVTHDVAVFPEGASDEDFLWRASIATIAAAGPFSSFPGVERTLLLLRGELVVALGGTEHRLHPGSAALPFAGEEAVSAYPAGEACTVLNIMVRRDRASAGIDLPPATRSTSATALLILATGPASIAVSKDVFALSVDDALLLDRPADPPSINGPVIAVEFFY